MLVCVLVVRVYPYGVYWATVVDNKGIQDFELTKRFAKFLQHIGAHQIAYRSDQESSITSLITEACKLSGRRVLPISAEREGQEIEAHRLADVQGQQADSGSGTASSSYSLEPGPSVVDPAAKNVKA